MKQIGIRIAVVASGIFSVPQKVEAQSSEHAQKMLTDSTGGKPAHV